MASLIPKIPVELDRPRYLCLDYAALQAIEEATGTPYYDLFQTGRRFTARELAIIVWAGLLDDDPSLTLAQVGKLFGPKDLPRVLQAVSKVLEASTPDEEDAGANGTEASAVNPQIPQHIGSASGVSPAMTLG